MWSPNVARERAAAAASGNVIVHDVILSLYRERERERASVDCRLCRLVLPIVMDYLPSLGTGQNHCWWWSW